MLNCLHFQNQQCTSCQWIEKNYSNQLIEKIAHLKSQLEHLDQSTLQWIAPFQSAQANFRNKAKMVVSGAVERPILGILKDPTDPQSAVELIDCELYPKSFASLFSILKDFIGRAGLVPYNIQK